MPRHQALNDVIWRSLTKASVPTVKEPDGMSLIPWCSGKSIVWDVTAVNTMAESYIATSSQTAAGAAEIADRRKVDKYSSLPSSCMFQSIAVETMGSFNRSGLDFIVELGRRMQEISGDLREGDFLFQRISVTIQRFSAVAFGGSFVGSRGSDH